LSSGSATYSFSSPTTGSHIVTATYSGDSTYAASTGTLVLTVGASSGTFTLTATNVTVSAGNSGNSTITITPKSGYTGTIAWTVSASASLSNACYSISDATVSGTSPVQATMTVHTSASECSNASVRKGGGKRRFIMGSTIARWIDSRPFSGLNTAKATFSIAVLLLVGLLGYRPRRFRAYAGVFLLAASGFGLSGCGSSSSSSGSSNATKGTYTLTIVGTDSTSSSIAASTTMTLTID
jgi:hypothetical protein